MDEVKEHSLEYPANLRLAAAFYPRHDPRTVLDSDCRLRGVAGLRVVDASAMPLITSGNTNTPVMLIAARGAESILSETHSS